VKNNFNSELLGKTLEWHASDLNSPPSLAENELHLWYLPLKLSASQADQAIGMLNQQQLNKLNRRSDQELKQAYLAGRYYLMSLLAAYNSMSVEEISLAYSRLNKPYLKPNPCNIQFNLTDTCLDGKSVGLFAFTQVATVGVDLEFLNRQSRYSAIVTRRFSEAETDFVTLDNGKIDERRFLALWTRKEAYGKAIGQGINFKMRDMDLASPDSFELNFHSQDGQDLALRLEQIQIEDNLIAAVVHSGHKRLEIKSFS